jgi:hypothetical protein
VQDWPVLEQRLEKTINYEEMPDRYPRLQVSWARLVQLLQLAGKLHGVDEVDKQAEREGTIGYLHLRLPSLSAFLNILDK